MSTIARNTPLLQETPTLGYGFLIGTLATITFAVVFFIYGLPFIAHIIDNANMSVPEPIDVNGNVQRK